MSVLVLEELGWSLQAGCACKSSMCSCGGLQLVGRIRCMYTSELCSGKTGEILSGASRFSREKLLLTLEND